MGKEDLIYGKRHGDMIRTQLPGNDHWDEFTDWPLALEIVHGGKAPEVVVHVIQFDQETGYRQEQNPLAVVTLDRGGCNRLIKAVRKHRDRAFGPDE